MLSTISTSSTKSTKNGTTLFVDATPDNNGEVTFSWNSHNQTIKIGKVYSGLRVRIELSCGNSDQKTELKKEKLHLLSILENDQDLVVGTLDINNSTWSSELDLKNLLKQLSEIHKRSNQNEHSDTSSELTSGIIFEGQEYDMQGVGQLGRFPYDELIWRNASDQNNHEFELLLKEESKNISSKLIFGRQISITSNYTTALIYSLASKKPIGFRISVKTGEEGVKTSGTAIIHYTNNGQSNVVASTFSVAQAVEIYNNTIANSTNDTREQDSTEMALIEDGNGRVFPIPRFKAKSTSNENRILHLALRSENGSITIEQPDANEKNVVNFRLFGIGIYFSPFFHSELMRFHFSNYSYNPIKITFLDGKLEKDIASTFISPIVSCGFLNVKEKRVDGLDSLNISRFAEVPHLLERISKYAKDLRESKSEDNFEISVDEGKSYYSFPIGISDWIMGRMLKSFLSGTNKIIIKGKTLSDSALNITIVDLNTRIPVIKSDTEEKITKYQVSVEQDSYTVEFFDESGKLVEKKQNIKRKKERVRLIRFYEERDSASDPKIYDYSDASVKAIESDTPPTLTSTIKPTWRLHPLKTNSVISSELQQGKDPDSVLKMIAMSHSLAGLSKIAEDYDLIRANLPGHFIMALVYAGIKNLTFIDKLPPTILTFAVPICDFSSHDTENNFQITDVVLHKQFAHLSKAKTTVVEAEPETLEKHDLVICHGLNRFESPVTSLTNALNSTKLEGNIIIVLSGHQGTEELQNILIENGFQIQDFNARILTYPKSKELNIRRAIAKTRVIVAKKIADIPTEQSINLEIPLTSRLNGNEEIDQLLSLVRTDSKTDSRTILDVVRAFELLDVLMENPETRIDLYNLVTLANHLMEVGFPDKEHFKGKYKIAAASKEEIAAVIKRIEKDLVQLDVSPVKTGENLKKLSGIEKQVVGLSDDMQYYTMTLKLLNWILEQEKVQFF